MMRAVFSIVGLVLVLAIVGVLVKKQVAAGVAPATASGMPGTAATPQQQVQQFKNAAEAALQQARPMPEEPR